MNTHSFLFPTTPEHELELLRLSIRITAKDIEYYRSKAVLAGLIEKPWDIRFYATRATECEQHLAGLQARLRELTQPTEPAGETP